MKEPYPYIKSSYFTEKAPCQEEIPSFCGKHSGSQGEHFYSPDPLYFCHWPDPGDMDGLELFLRRPVRFWTENPEIFDGIFAGEAKEKPVVALDHQEQNRHLKLMVLGKGLLCMDFGVECAGWLEFDSNREDLAERITLGISEYNQPAIVNAGPVSPVKTARPVRYGGEDSEEGYTYRLELNEELYEGVRFGFLTVTDFESPFAITDIRLVCQAKPVHYLGSFQSDSDLVNRIWYTAAYTVRVNLRQDYFAAILMDRGDRFSWTGDAYPAQAASLVAFANYEAVLRNLHYTAAHSNGIESYEMYWIFSLEDYYRYTGDLQGVRGLLQEAMSRLEHAWDIFDTDCRLGFLGWDERLGAGFENPDTKSNRFLYRCLAVRAWKGFAPILEELGEEEAAATLRGWAAEKIPVLKRQLAELEDTRGGKGGCGIHGAAEVILTGICGEEKTGKLWERYFQDRGNRLSLSPFNQYFLLQAMAAAGKYEEALCAVEDLWGGQLQHGATTFYETFRPQWNSFLESSDPVPNNQAGYTSLAHPWSAGILHWIQEEILGIRPLAAGFCRFQVLPHPEGRFSRLSGKTPSPRGDIVFSWDWNKGTSTLLVPEGSSGRLGLPKLGCDVKLVSIRHWKPGSQEFEEMRKGRAETGEILKQREEAGIDGKIHRAMEAIREDTNFLYLECTPGFYQISFRATGERRRYRQEPYQYPMAFLGEDAVTGGRWRGKYGKDGFLFFNGRNGGKGSGHLPDYVETVTWRKARQVIWEGVAEKRCILQDFSKDPGQEQQIEGQGKLEEIREESRDKAGEGSGFGGLCTNDPVACDQTFTIDIQLSAAAFLSDETAVPARERSYMLTLYFADGDGNGRVSEVELYRLDTLELAAPPSLVRNYAKGKYLTYSCSGSVRVRINQVRGRNAVLCGLFLDSQQF